MMQSCVEASRICCSLGYDVVTFASAEAFLESGKAEVAACLITDVKLSGWSGPDLQERLIADGKRLPIIFVTGFATENLRAQVLAAGAVGFLSKPCDEGELIGCLNKAVSATGRAQSQEKL